MDPQKTPPEPVKDSPASPEPAVPPVVKPSSDPAGFAGSFVSSSIDPAKTVEPPSTAEAPVAPEAVSSNDAPEPASLPQDQTPVPAAVVMKSDPLPMTHRKRGKKGLIVGLLATALVLILGGGAAASYYYMVNKPENILMQALANSLDMEKVKTTQFSGEVEAKDTKTNMNASASFKGAADNKTGAFDISGQVDALVTTMTFDFRSADSKTFYFKIGGLEGISELLGLSGEASQYAPLFDAFNDQWIEINESLIKQADSSYQSAILTEADAKKTVDAYKAHPFLVVKEKLADQVLNGENHYHYKVAIDPAKLKDFLTALKDAKLDSYKMNQETLDAFKKGVDDAKLENLPFEVWISKVTKLINQVSFSYQQDTAAMTMRLTVDSYNKPVNVEKPAGAKSILEMVGELFGGFESGAQFELPAELQSGSGISL
jgi:hypothetical protein